LSFGGGAGKDIAVAGGRGVVGSAKKREMKEKWIRRPQEGLEDSPSVWS
jgi:hypothetical protein